MNAPNGAGARLLPHVSGNARDQSTRTGSTKPHNKNEDRLNESIDPAKQNLINQHKLEYQDTPLREDGRCSSTPLLENDRGSKCIITKFDRTRPKEPVEQVNCRTKEISSKTHSNNEISTYPVPKPRSLLPPTPLPRTLLPSLQVPKSPQYSRVPG